MKPFTLAELNSRLHELIGEEVDDERARVRTRLLDAAVDQFVTFGYRRANIGDIARSAGVGKGTVYLYFDSKKTVLIAAVAREKLVLTPRFAALMEASDAERIPAYIELFLRFVHDSPLMRRLLQRDPDIERLMREYSDGHPDEAEAAIGFLSGLFTGALAHLDDAERELRIRTLQVALRSTAHVLDDLASSGLDAESFLRSYTQILTAGLVAP